MYIEIDISVLSLIIYTDYMMEWQCIKSRADNLLQRIALGLTEVVWQDNPVAVRVSIFFIVK